MGTMTITLYSKPNCGPCMASKRAMEKMGVGFFEESGPDNVDLLRELGHSQAPVTVIREGNGADEVGEILDHWSGFRPDKIEEWAT